MTPLNENSLDDDPRHRAGVGAMINGCVDKIFRGFNFYFMLYELLRYLRCPVTKKKLRFALISESVKEYAGLPIREIWEGILYSETGFVFPIINGIPRMLVESLYDYAAFLEKHLPGYQKIKTGIEANHKALLRYCSGKNRKTKACYELEWSLLKPEKADKIWHEDIANLESVFVSETDMEIDRLRNKKILDLGCGHGIMTATMAPSSQLTIGVDLCRSVETAYRNNSCQKAWYVQADLQYLPFEEETFDLLYCSGVIHHTNHTELSLLLIEPVIKVQGRICLWLYHPQKSSIHHFLLAIRSITRRLPLKWAFAFLRFFLFPVTYLVKRIKRKTAPNYREEMIDLLDQFTPEFRFETPQELAATWLLRKQYTTIRITTENNFGFSIIGDKAALVSEVHSTAGKEAARSRPEQVETRAISND